MHYKISIRRAGRQVAVLEVAVQTTELDENAVAAIMYDFETRFNGNFAGASGGIFRAHIEKVEPASMRGLT